VNLICANCGKKEGPDATYCRDCYTVFPAEVRAAANRPVKRSGTPAAWKLVPVVAIFVLAFLYTQVDFGTKPPKEAPVPAKPDDPWAPGAKAEQAGSPDLAAGKARGLADQARSNLGGGHGDGFEKLGGRPNPRIAEAIRAANQYLGWVLQSDAELACPSGDPCAATIKFASGDEGSYYVERYIGTSNTVIPANDEASRLLATNTEGVLEMKLPGGAKRSTALEKSASRWSFGTSGGAFETKSEDISARQGREE